MGFRRFSGGAPVGSSSACPGSFAEAAERPLYVAHNLLHLDVGNPSFGDVALVLTPSYARPMSLIEPVDTGNWESACNATATATAAAAAAAGATNAAATNAAAASPASARCGFPLPLNCSAWPERRQGTFGSLTHTLVANSELWNSGANYAVRMLAALAS